MKRLEKRKYQTPEGRTKNITRRGGGSSSKEQDRGLKMAKAYNKSSIQKENDKNGKSLYHKITNCRCKFIPIKKITLNEYLQEQQESPKKIDKDLGKHLNI